MTRRIFLLFLILAIIVAGFSLVFAAQCRMGSSCSVANTNKACAMWDAKSVKTIEGEVVSVSPCCRVKGNGSCTVATVKTASGNIKTMLGPSAYLADKKFVLKPKDKITVVGSEVTMSKGNCMKDGKGCKGDCLCEGKAIMAKEVRSGKSVLTLRNDKGMPLWNCTGPNCKAQCPIKHGCASGQAACTEAAGGCNSQGCCSR